MQDKKEKVFIMAGYTAGVAESLYNGFVKGTYLDVETYKDVSRETALERFTDDYGTVYGEDEEEFVSGKIDYTYSDEYSIMYDDDTHTATISSESINYVNDLATGGYTYKLTDEGQELFDAGEEVTVDDFEYIRLGVAGERLGDISVWYDIVNDMVGGRDFPERSVSRYNGDISDALDMARDTIIWEINH